MATECSKCGEKTRDIWDEDDFEGFKRDGEVYCQECYLDDYTFACSWCEDHHEELDTQDDYVAVFDADAAGLALPGFYRVLATPYYQQSLLGNGYLFAEELQWLGPLPEGLEEPWGSPCGHFCRACQQRMLGLLATKHGLIHDVR